MAAMPRGAKIFVDGQLVGDAPASWVRRPSNLRTHNTEPPEPEEPPPLPYAGANIVGGWGRD
jgi:hypothetical protein